MENTLMAASASNHTSTSSAAPFILLVNTREHTLANGEIWIEKIHLLNQRLWSQFDFFILQVQGRRKEVAKVIKNAARTNNVVLSDMAMQKLTPGSNSDSDETEDDERIRIQTTQSWKSFLKSTPMILRVLNCSFCWFTNAFVFYGLSLNSVAIAGNKYLNFILVSLIEVPAHVVTYILSDRLGRRTLLCGALISSGVACFASKFVATGKRYYETKGENMKKIYSLKFEF